MLWSRRFPLCSLTDSPVLSTCGLSGHHLCPRVVLLSVLQRLFPSDSTPLLLAGTFTVQIVSVSSCRAEFQSAPDAQISQLLSIKLLAILMDEVLTVSIGVLSASPLFLRANPRHVWKALSLRRADYWLRHPTFNYSVVVLYFPSSALSRFKMKSLS